MLPYAWRIDSHSQVSQGGMHLINLTLLSGLSLVSADRYLYMIERGKGWIAASLSVYKIFSQEGQQFIPNKNQQYHLTETHMINQILFISVFTGSRLQSIAQKASIVSRVLHKPMACTVLKNKFCWIPRSGKCIWTSLWTKMEMFDYNAQHYSLHISTDTWHQLSSTAEEGRCFGLVLQPRDLDTLQPPSRPSTAL